MATIATNVLDNRFVEYGLLGLGAYLLYQFWEPLSTVGSLTDDTIKGIANQTDQAIDFTKLTGKAMSEGGKKALVDIAKSADQGNWYAKTTINIAQGVTKILYPNDQQPIATLYRGDQVGDPCGFNDPNKAMRDFWNGNWHNPPKIQDEIHKRITNQKMNLQQAYYDYYHASSAGTMYQLNLSVDENNQAVITTYGLPQYSSNDPNEKCKFSWGDTKYPIGIGYVLSYKNSNWYNLPQPTKASFISDNMIIWAKAGMPKNYFDGSQSEIDLLNLNGVSFFFDDVAQYDTIPRWHFTPT